MPGLYNEAEYDLAGTIVGIVDRSRIIDGSAIREGDAIIALRSSGLHTNGYSLARKICFEVEGLGITDTMPYVGRPVGEALLEPHRSYSKVMQLVLKTADVSGMVHITGGGITDNLPRVLPEGTAAEIDPPRGTPCPFSASFRRLGVADAEMLRTFNMGVGFLLIVSKDEEEKALKTLSQACEDPRSWGASSPGMEKFTTQGRFAMPHRIEVGMKAGLHDPAGDATRQRLAEDLGIRVDDVHVLDVYTINARLDDDELERVRTELFTDPISTTPQPTPRWRPVTITSSRSASGPG